MVGTKVRRRSYGWWGSYGVPDMVGERSLGVEASSEEQGWSAGKRACRNEYARNRVRISVTESLRVPEPGSSAPG